MRNSFYLQWFQLPCSREKARSHNFFSKGSCDTQIFFTTTRWSTQQRMLFPWKFPQRFFHLKPLIPTLIHSKRVQSLDMLRKLDKVSKRQYLFLNRLFLKTLLSVEILHNNPRLLYHWQFDDVEAMSFLPKNATIFWSLNLVKVRHCITLVYTGFVWFLVFWIRVEHVGHIDGTAAMV